ncbi:MAG: hypothetical protein IJ164_02475 [Duodenibacillus sp.]|nr:hypothetical protein [Duodenibacillus sp.]
MRLALFSFLASMLSALPLVQAASQSAPEQSAPAPVLGQELVTPAKEEMLSAPTPFAYPAGALGAHPTFQVSPATPAKLGDTLVVFEHSLLLDVALIAKAPVHNDEEGGGPRQWICVQAMHEKEPVRLWFISSSAGRVTEAQMEAGSFGARQQFCGNLPSYFSPVSLSMISIGDYVGNVEHNIGPASLKDDGWSYWVSRRNYDFDGKKLTEYVWVGARTGEKGRIDRVFSSQFTQ